MQIQTKHLIKILQNSNKYLAKILIDSNDTKKVQQQQTQHKTTTTNSNSFRFLGGHQAFGCRTYICNNFNNNIKMLALL